MIWDASIETLSREGMQQLQLERLRKTVDTILARVPYTAEKIRAAGVTSGNDVGSLADLEKLPFTTKEDLLDNYPFGLLAAPLNEIVRIHASSGTKGKPKIVGYTRNDLTMWSNIMARAMCLAGVRPGMIVQNAYGYGLFTGGFGLHQGAELLGCTVIPISGGMTGRQVQFLRDLRPQVLACTPSYALSIADALDEVGLAPGDLQLELGVFGAEPWTEEMRGQIEQRLGIEAINIYGLSEIVGPGVSTECREGRSGSHIQEDHFLPEVVDPDTSAPLPAGRQGELVFTTLTKEGMPILRYRTRDISSLEYEPCVCGRTTARMTRIVGRYDDMLIVRGVNLYPSEIERILLGVDGVAPHYQVILDRPHTLDEITLMCEPAHAEVDVVTLRDRLQHALREQTGLGVAVRVLEREQIPRSEGKAVRVIDRRSITGVS
jgi:phenylacetate-CoA ligase